MLQGNNFTFVENPKTASTSMQNTFRRAGIENTVNGKHSNLFSDSLITRMRNRMVVVRNPWDRLVSGFHYNMRSRHKGKPLDGLFEPWLLGEPWVTGDGPDFKRCSQLFWTHKCTDILFFEELHMSFYRWWCKVGLDKRKFDFSRDNVSHERGPYQEYYTDTTRKVVEDRFYGEIQKFGYKF